MGQAKKNHLMLITYGLKQVKHALVGSTVKGIGDIRCYKKYLDYVLLVSIVFEILLSDQVFIFSCWLLNVLSNILVCTPQSNAVTRSSPRRINSC